MGRMARPSRWDDVVRAAGKVFRRNGFARASLEEIAEELGMWKGSLYNYISSKDDLLAAVIAIPAERLTAEMRGSPPVPAAPRNACARSSAATSRCSSTTTTTWPSTCRRWPGARSATSGAPTTASTPRSSKRVVREGIESGTIPVGRDPRLMTMTLVGALNWLTRWWDPAGDIGPELVTAQIADIVLGPAPVRTG